MKKNSKTFSVSLIAGLLLGLLTLTAYAAQGYNLLDLANYETPVYSINELGLTYGSAVQAMSIEDEPDLIAAVGVDGTEGYVYKSDLDGDLPETPEEAIAYQAAIDEKMAGATPGTPVVMDVIPLYAADGVTVIGEFEIINIAD